jgi:hypothetical protein
MVNLLQIYVKMHFLQTLLQMSQRVSYLARFAEKVPVLAVLASADF